MVIKVDQVGHQGRVAKLGGQVQAATSLTIPTQRFGMVIKVLLSLGHQVGHQSSVAKLGGQVQQPHPSPSLHRVWYGN
jgi:hypothetical protein